MDSNTGATATLVQQQHQTLDGNHHQGQKEQDNVNGTVESAEGHAVDRFCGKAQCSVKEIAVVAPDNDSVGDSSTCSDVIDDDNEEEETDVEESGTGGWILNPPVSTIVQQHQAFDPGNGYIALPNPDSSNFSDVRIKDSSNVHLGNEVNYHGPVTIHVNHVVYTNPTLNQDAIELDVINASDNIADSSTSQNNEIPNESIFPQNTELNNVCIGSGYTQTNNCGLILNKQKFRCCNGECIASDLLCDGKTDCRDLSDETEAECKRPEILCPNYAFRCNYGACIDKDLVCNGVSNCADNSDETQPQCLRNTTNTRTERCRENEFQCDNGQCISSDAVCDGTRNCADGSDETSKLCQSLPCPSTAFHCAYGACIDADLRCNRVDDCADSSDEDQELCRTGWPPVLPSVRPTTGTTRSPPTPAPTPTRPSRTPSGTNTCKAPPQPQNGRWKLHRSQCSDGQNCNVPEGTELGLGSYLVYSCDSGYKIRGSPDVSCSIGGKWLNIPVCRAILCKALAAPSIRSECRYDDEWISCKSPVPPRTRATLSCENSYRPETNQHLLSGQGTNVRCKANGEWEPEPMRCVPVCGTLPLGYQLTVVGGFRPNITEFPWHASMYRDEPGEPKKYFCGASIIQKNLLITAAHCVYDEFTRQPIDPNTIYILTGNLFRDYNNLFHNPIFVKRNQVKRIYIERNYVGYIGNFLSDIAVLELVTPFVLSSYLVPACIDTLSYGNVLEPGTYGKVAVFGRRAIGEPRAWYILQALTVPVISLSQCRSASQSVNMEQYVTNDKFCAGYTNGSSVSDGDVSDDSGGGLVFKTNNLWYLRGIVSDTICRGTMRGDFHGTKSFHCDYYIYSLYTEISRYIPWIQDVMTKIEQNQTHTLCSEQSSTRCS
ncbi:uncharacterized protein [Temnothorax longispinosus]|uniref:uncharacterized protein isoform X2 n=1 Tax=Temnothorax longispinosus TaxID=300112 RepID=UPI003A993283